MYCTVPQDAVRKAGLHVSHPGVCLTLLPEDPVRRHDLTLLR